MIQAGESSVSRTPAIWPRSTRTTSARSSKLPGTESSFPARGLGRRLGTEIELTARGSRLATSVGGTLTGRGGDLIIIDDPLKPDDAYSEAKRNAANEWFKNTLLSRLDDKRTGAIIIVMQRVHMDDLAGFVTSQSDEWEILDLPAIAELDEHFRYRIRKSIGVASARRFHRSVSRFQFSRI